MNNCIKEKGASVVVTTNTPNKNDYITTFYLLNYTKFTI